MEKAYCYLPSSKCFRRARRSAGRALLDGTDLLTLSPREMNRIRGQRISYVPQGSGNGMNPLLSVGYQVGEPLMIHQNLSKKEALARGCRSPAPF